MTIEQIRNIEDRSAQVEEILNELSQYRIPGRLLVRVTELADLAEITIKRRETERLRLSNRRGVGNIRQHTPTNANVANGYISKSNISLTKESKKVSKILLPDDWKPSPDHYTLAHQLGLSEKEVGDGAAEMRAWSLGNGERRLNWDWVFNNWLRRNAKGRNGNVKVSQTYARPKTARERWGERLQSLGSGEFLAGSLGLIPDPPAGGSGRLSSDGGSNIRQIPLRSGQNGGHASGDSVDTSDLFAVDRRDPDVVGG